MKKFVAAYILVSVILLFLSAFAEMLGSSADTGTIYLISFCLVIIYFFFKYILGNRSKIMSFFRALGKGKVKVEIIHGHGVPKGVMKFTSWYLDRKKGLSKIGDDNLFADFFLKIGVILIWIAGESLLRITAFYLWLNRIVFGKDPEWW